MKCVIHEILHVKYLPVFARLLKKPWTKRRWQIIYVGNVIFIDIIRLGTFSAC
jgi:hypothetical protein